MSCPLCNNPIIKDKHHNYACSIPITLDNSTFPHYEFNPTLNRIVMIAMPYRIITFLNSQNYSIIQKYDYDAHYFKLGMNTSFSIMPATESALLDKIKTILLLS